MKFDLSKLGAIDEERAVLNVQPIGAKSRAQQQEDGKEAESALGVDFLLGVYKSLKGDCGALIDLVTRILYACSVAISIALCVIFFFNRSFLAWNELTWFPFVVWGFIVFAEVLLVVSRLSARWTMTGELAYKVVERGSSCWPLVDMIMKRKAFGAWWQAIIVILVQIVGSCFILLGILIIQSRMLIDDDATMTAGFSAIFIFVIFSTVLCAFADSLRVKDIDSSDGWHLALITLAWRLIILIVVAILSIVFVIFANVCCDNSWLTRR